MLCQIAIKVCFGLIFCVCGTFSRFFQDREALLAGEESGILSWAEGGKKDSQPAGSEVELRVKRASFRSICAGFNKKTKKKRL